jgi:starch synthase
MREDFSWNISARKYSKLYSDILGLPPEETAPEPEAELILGNG